jgi:hypothetical protein
MLLKQILNELGGGLVIDLGCGEGSVNSTKGFSVVGVDIETPKKFRGDFFLAGDMRKLPIKDRVAKIVVMSHSLEHVEGFEMSLDEATRTSGKFLYITVPDGGSLDDRLFRTLGKIVRGKSSHVNRFSFQDIIDGVERRGFRLVESGNVKSGFTYLPKPIDKTMVKIASATDKIFSSKTQTYGWEFLFERTGDLN